MILSTLIGNERYGLEIVEIKMATDGKPVLSLGDLYTTRHRMEEKGLVVARGGESSGVRRGCSSEILQHFGRWGTGF
jgi:DNA-binding PadR family transcriptional regulator